MSQPSPSSSPLKRANVGQSRADRHKQRKTVTFNPSDTTVTGTSDTTLPGASDTTVPGTSDTTVPGTSNTSVHEEPSRSSPSSPSTPTISLKFFPPSFERESSRNGAEFFSPPPESDTNCNMSKPATSQSTSWPRGQYARRAKVFTPKYASPGPSRLELKNTSTIRNQSIYGASDSEPEPDKSSSGEDDDSDKENEDPEAPRSNKVFKESGTHPPQHLQVTESEEPVGSSSIYFPFPPEYQPSQQDVYVKNNRFKEGNMLFSNRPPFSGPNMQSQQVSNGPLHDHVQEGSKDNEGLEDQIVFKTLMIDSMKAIRRQNDSLEASATSSRRRFMEEERHWPERMLYQREATSIEEKVYNNNILILSHFKLMSGDKNLQN